MITVIDNAIDVSKYFPMLVGMEFTYTRSDPNPEVPNGIDLIGQYWTHQFYWSQPNFNNQSFVLENNIDFLHRLLFDAKDILPNNTELYSAYSNILNALSCPVVHTDAPFNIPENKTVLFYLNDEWNPNWGGETVFYDENFDIIKSILPKPGRCIIFDGRIPHSARPPVSRFRHNRYIITLKYMDINQRTQQFNNQNKIHESNTFIGDYLIPGYTKEMVKKVLSDQT